MTTRIEIPAKEKSATLLLASRLLHLASGFFFDIAITHPCNVFTIPHTTPDCLKKLGCLDGIPTDYVGEAPPAFCKPVDRGFYRIKPGQTELNIETGKTFPANPAKTAGGKK